MSSRRAVIAGSVGALALAAIGYRAWDRGAFVGASGPASRPWDEWPGSEDDGDRRPLRSAILAASPHDSQPWLFALSPGSIAIYADRARHLGSFDPFRREMHLGLGCAIENLVLAARVFGAETEVRAVGGRLEPSPGPQPALAARIALTPGPARPDPSSTRFRPAIRTAAPTVTSRSPPSDCRRSPIWWQDPVFAWCSPRKRVSVGIWV